jgi:hypothetical protein
MVRIAVGCDDMRPCVVDRVLAACLDAARFGEVAGRSPVTPCAALAGGHEAVQSTSSKELSS